MSLRKKLVGAGAGLTLAAGAMLGVGSQATAAESGAAGVVCGEKVVVDGTWAYICVSQVNGVYGGDVRYAGPHGGAFLATIVAHEKSYGQCLAVLRAWQVGGCTQRTVPMSGNSPSDVVGEVQFTDSEGTLHVITVSIFGGSVETVRG